MAYDLAPIAVIKVGDAAAGPGVPAGRSSRSGPAGRRIELEVDLRAAGADVALSADRRQLELGWTVEVPARGSARVEWTLDDR